MEYREAAEECRVGCRRAGALDRHLADVVLAEGRSSEQRREQHEDQWTAAHGLSLSRARLVGRAPRCYENILKPRPAAEPSNELRVNPHLRTELLPTRP